MFYILWFLYVIRCILDYIIGKCEKEKLINIRVIY